MVHRGHNKASFCKIFGHKEAILPKPTTTAGKDEGALLFRALDASIKMESRSKTVWYMLEGPVIVGWIPDVQWNGALIGTNCRRIAHRVCGIQ